MLDFKLCSSPYTLTTSALVFKTVPYNKDETATGIIINSEPIAAFLFHNDATFSIRLIIIFCRLSFLLIRLNNTITDKTTDTTTNTINIFLILALYLSIYVMQTKTPQDNKTFSIKFL